MLQYEITIKTLANSTDPNLPLYGSNYLSIVGNEQFFLHRTKIYT